MASNGKFLFHKLVWFVWNCGVNLLLWLQKIVERITRKCSHLVSPLSLLVAACGNSLQKDANSTEDVTGTHSSGDIPSLSSLSHTLGGTTQITGLSNLVTEKYTNYPTSLNGEYDFTHLEVDYSKLNFFSKPGPLYELSAGYTGMVYYGNAGDINGDGSPEIVISGWTVNTGNAPGRIFILEVDQNNGIKNVSWAENQGTAAPWVYDFDDDGSAEVLSIGFFDFPVAPAETVYFDGDLTSQSIIGPLIDSHESSLVDYDNDGDLDVVAISYNNVNGLISLYRNTGTNFVHEYLPSLYDNYFASGSSIEYADFDSDGKGEFVVGDYAGDGGIAILKLDSDGEFLNSPNWKDILTIRPYFEHDDFSGVNSIFTSSNPNATEEDIIKFRSHDIVLKAIDIDNDGDLDLINSTSVWHDETPFGVLQILINDGMGSFTDETNARLFNYSLTANAAHDLIFMDINNDGFFDILNPEGGSTNSNYRENGLAIDFAQLTEGNTILINDGTGHFLKIMFAPFSRPGTYHEDGFHYPNKWYPFVHEDGSLGFIQLDHGWTNYPNGEFDLFNYAHLDQIFYTGPEFVNPAIYGVPGFNEFYVLRNNLEVQAFVKSGKYGSALEWYIETGQDDLNIFAANAKVIGTEEDDTIVLREGGEVAYGNGGNDIFVAKEGNDILTGGTGSDTFIFSGNKSMHSHNTITDFNIEEGDKIDLSAFGISNAVEALERSTININATFIEISESVTITVEHVDLSSDLSWIA